MSWIIDKVFEFDYGHRVHTQVVRPDFCESGDARCVCRHIHGHRGSVHVFLEGDDLNYQGMVIDFKELGWLKNFLDNNIDHKFVIDVNDPDFNNIINGAINENGSFTPSRTGLKTLPLVNVKVPGTNIVVGRIIDVHGLTGCNHEFYEGFFLVDFVPTSENLSKWVFEVVDAKMKTIDVTVSRIDWFETPKSRSTYLRNTNNVSAELD